MASEVMTFTRSQGTGSASVVFEHREADISGYALSYTGNIWQNFMCRREGRVRLGEIPGYQGADGKDFEGDVVTYTVFGFIISAGDSKSLVNRYDGLQTQRDEILKMIGRKTTYNVNGPFVETGSGGALIVRKPNFGLIDAGGQQPFDFECIVLRGK